jgi:acetyl esterase/lipase
MKHVRICWLIGVALVLAWFIPAPAADKRPPFTRKQDVIYGRKYGTALTMDVIKPASKPNGAAIIHVMSGGWFSSHDWINPRSEAVFLSRGYTIFAVVHGSQPKYTIPEILQDMNRAVRFIRYHAKDYGIDPQRIGITGGSAGGHLSLMQGTTGRDGDPKAKDPVDRVSSTVQAVACFFPPTDFLNYGEKGRDVFHFKAVDFVHPAFDFHQFNPKTHRLERITDEKKVLEVLRDISPLYHVSAATPPTLIAHGTKDHLVPIQQVQDFVARLKESNVPNRLIVKEGQDHGWKGMDRDLETFADWFDQYLVKRQ